MTEQPIEEASTAAEGSEPEVETEPGGNAASLAEDAADDGAAPESILDAAPVEDSDAASSTAASKES